VPPKHNKRIANDAATTPYCGVHPILRRIVENASKARNTFPRGSPCCPRAIPHLQPFDAAILSQIKPPFKRVGPSPAAEGENASACFQKSWPERPAFVSPCGFQIRDRCSGAPMADTVRQMQPDGNFDGRVRASLLPTTNATASWPPRSLTGQRP